MGSRQDGSVIQEIAKAQAFEKFLRADRAIRRDPEAGPENSLIGQFGVQQKRSKVNGLLTIAIGTASSHRPGRAVQ